MAAKDTSLLKIALAEIINGHSPATSTIFGKFFIKHFSNVDNAEIEQEYSRVYTLAIDNDLPTLEQREVEILENKYWDKAKVDKIRDIERFIPNLRLTKSKLLRDNDKDAVQKQIDDAENELLKLRLIKNALIGSTAESFASKKVNEHFIYQAIFDGPDLKTKKFTNADYDELDESDIRDLVDLYNNSLEKFNERIIKKLSISPQFCNAFHLSNDNPFTFYGKPIIHLTFYQIDLFAHAKYYKSIIQNSTQKVPQEVLNDPDKLIDWFNATQNTEKLIQETDRNLARMGKESGGGGVAIVGLSSEQSKSLGIKNEGGDRLMKMAQAKGGTLTFEDIIRAEGV